MWEAFPSISFPEREADMSSVFKRVFASCFYGYKFLTGIKRSPFILTYHSIDSSRSAVSVTPEMFMRQIRYLKKQGYRAVSLDEYKNNLEKSGDSCDAVCVITFDDGFKSVYETAYPILKQYAFTATIFLPTAYMGKRCTWEKENAIPEKEIMSWEEAAAMHKEGFDFQPHTETHPSLSRLSEQDQEKEIQAGKEAVENKLGKKCNFFCYPFGDYNAVTADILKRNGFEGALTIEFGRNDARSDRYRLKRLGSARFSGSMRLFKAAVADTGGTLDFFRKTRRKFSNFKQESALSG
jgi:peptidoglycan/xylan/chitin deacetylase (PgdA/CDA1 family)